MLGATFARTAPDQNTDSPAAQKAFMQQVQTVYPDFHIVRNVDTFGKDVAFTQWTVTGTFTAEVAILNRFSGGKIVEEVALYDTAGLSAQTGQTAVPHAAVK